MLFDGITISIEVTVKDGDTSKQRGDLLESLAKRVLVSMQHEHVQTEVRVAGCELDLIAREKQTNRRILVECKAYRDKNIQAEVLTKMLGNSFIHDYESAWLITTAKLGKDALGALEKIRDNPQKSQRIKIYDPLALVELLVSTSQILDPTKLKLPTSLRATPIRTLMLTDIGEFWAATIVGEKSGIADTVIVFDAVTGDQVTNAALVQQLGDRDSNLRELSWVTGEDQLATVSAIRDVALKQEMDNIAPVPMADDWSDYRPARPKDFVGRDDLINGIINFFNDARNQKTGTRLLAIKAPSGWGKSSFLVKLRSMCLHTEIRDNVFLYAVDCRTASSPRYPELALHRCFDEAIATGFVKSDNEPIVIGSSGQPFSDKKVSRILTELRDSNKLIVLFFDQFEEITTKQELSELFNQVKYMCSGVESAGENVILGFSWKTDGTIPTDHPAYHVWHSFADRRKEFELPLFSKKDMSDLLSRLSRELKQPIEPWLRRLLSEHSQGYPWLLKKLCVHVFRVLQTQPARQRELFERALDVEALFQKDLADLGAAQIACLEKIARESPADYFLVVEKFGDSTVEALMQRRLILRSAGKLIVYWDIFRDYVLTKQVPAIPTRYIPVSSPATAKRVLDALSSDAFTQLPTLAKKLDLKNGTLDNISRDLVMMGACRYDRKLKRLKLTHARSSETLSSMFKFFKNHAFLRILIDQFTASFSEISFQSIESALAGQFDSDGFKADTIHVSVLRWLVWMNALGIMTWDGLGAVSYNSSQRSLSSFDKLRIGQSYKNKAASFKGEAPPARVIEVLEELAAGYYVPKPSDRNSLYVLRSIQLVASITEPVLLEEPPSTNFDLWLASKVQRQVSIQLARKKIAGNPAVGTLELGELLEGLTPRSLSESSKRRYGAGLLIWCNWLNGVLSTIFRVVPK